MKDYSLDLRQRIVRAVADGQAKAAVAQRFAVSLSTVKRYVRRLAATGTLAPSPRPGRPRAIPPGREPDLAAQVATANAATLAEHCRAWAAERGVGVSEATMSRALARAGLRRKKGR